MGGLMTIHDVMRAMVVSEGRRHVMNVELIRAAGCAVPCACARVLSPITPWACFARDTAGSARESRG
jgi:hypothetical protein